MRKDYKNIIEYTVSGFLLFTAIRKGVYVFSDVYIDIPSISYLTDDPNAAILIIGILSVIEIIIAIGLMFSNSVIKGWLIYLLIIFVLSGIIYSITELIVFGDSCFCGISKNPIISIVVKMILTGVLFLHKYGNQIILNLNSAKTDL